MADIRQEGIVARLRRDRGFGFIRRHDGYEYFFHRSAVLYFSFDRLIEGTKVWFEVEPNSPRGPRACNVEVAG